MLIITIRFSVFKKQSALLLERHGKKKKQVTMTSRRWPAPPSDRKGLYPSNMGQKWRTLMSYIILAVIKNAQPDI